MLFKPLLIRPTLEYFSHRPSSSQTELSTLAILKALGRSSIQELGEQVLKEKAGHGFPCGRGNRAIAFQVVWNRPDQAKSSSGCSRSHIETSAGSCAGSCTTNACNGPTRRVLHPDWSPCRVNVPYPSRHSPTRDPAWLYCNRVYIKQDLSRRTPADMKAKRRCHTASPLATSPDASPKDEKFVAG